MFFYLKKCSPPIDKTIGTTPLKVKILSHSPVEETGEDGGHAVGEWTAGWLMDAALLGRTSVTPAPVQVDSWRQRRA